MTIIKSNILQQKNIYSIIFVFVLKISIIIPTFNEEQIVEVQLKKLLSKIGNDNAEVIVVDAGEDNTFQIASQLNVKVIKSFKGRAIQMNNGVKQATGDILYFLHLDTNVPHNFLTAIRQSITENTSAGCFQMIFDDNHYLMQFYGWCTRLPFSFCRGGDQSLFITRTLFNKIGGFDESLNVMEDIEIIHRIKKNVKFQILKEKVTTSARKYNQNGRLRLQFIFGIIHLMYNLKFSNKRIVKFYKNMIR